MRGRPKALRTIASDMLRDSCIQSAEFVRCTSAAIEYVSAAKSMSGVKILVEERDEHDKHTPTVIAKSQGAHAEMQNGMPFQGYINCGDMLIPFYGSPESYRKCATL